MRVLQGGEREREGKRVWQSGLEKRCSWESDIGREKKVRRSGEQNGGRGTKIGFCVMTSSFRRKVGCLAECKVLSRSYL
jgi:hypothetical protein